MSRDLTEKSGLDKAIESVLADLEGFTSETEEFQKATDQLVKLHKLKQEEEAAEMDRIAKIHEIEVADRPKRVSPDTLALVAGNLLGIAVIVGHERAHIITSKAFSLIKMVR